MIMNRGVIFVGIAAICVCFCAKTTLAWAPTHSKASTSMMMRRTRFQQNAGIASSPQLTTPLAGSRNDDDYDEDTDDDDDDVATGIAATNVLGSQLCPCCTDVGGSGIGTGFYRNGYCATGQQDIGRHTVCVQVTDDFLQFSKAMGNDLSTPIPQYLFPGLNDGDIWCLCAQRYAQAYEAGKAPKVYLKSTHEKTLDYVPFEVLRYYAIDQSEADETIDTLNEQRERLNKLL